MANSQPQTSVTRLSYLSGKIRGFASRPHERFAIFGLRQD
jgi:hypothetical protein